MAVCHRLFVYGTLKRGFHNYFMMSDKSHGCSVFIGEAKLEQPHSLVVHPAHGVPFLLPNSSRPSDSQAPKEVYGELFEVDDSMLAVLDEFELCPTWYMRTETTCVLLSSESDKYQKGSSVSCSAYMKTDPGPEFYAFPFLSSFAQEDYVPRSQR